MLTFRMHHDLIFFVFAPKTVASLALTGGSSPLREMEEDKKLLSPQS